MLVSGLIIKQPKTNQPKGFSILLSLTVCVCVFVWAGEEEM